MKIDQVKHVKSFMSLDTANKLYEYAKSNTHQFIQYGNDEKQFTVHTYLDIKENNSEIAELMQESAMKVYEFVIENYPGPFSEFLPKKTNFAKFDPGVGMHDHFDLTKPNDIATLVYINDDYEGGEIYFKDLGLLIKPKAGDLVCFPDTEDFVHGVKEVLGCSRFTTPRWFTRIV